VSTLTIAALKERSASEEKLNQTAPPEILTAGLYIATTFINQYSVKIASISCAHAVLYS